jgi:4-diphosphocytidyl-2-C-methyl-D-erythritol kinase
MRPIALQACAKINLNLALLGRRDDGYHDIESLVQTITLCDRVTVGPAEAGIILEVDDPAVPAGDTNLAWRAAACLPAPERGPRGVRVRLQKRVPVGAGLGGGSADAAAVLVGVLRMRGARPDAEDLAARSAALGSDVPFFLTGGTAILRGRGERVEPLPDLAGYELLVVWPGLPLSTRAVYAAASAALTSTRKISRMTRFEPTIRGAIPRRVEEWVRVGNDLEPYAREFCPAIGEIQTRILDAGATAAAMSGSGSSVFGVFRDGAALGRAVRAMEERGYGAVRCAPLGRQDYQKRLGFA